MTNRDAINLLEEVKILDDTMYAYNPSYLEALDMALTALEAEETWYATHEYPPKSQWIPCSERLPEKADWYLCTYKDGRVNTKYWSKDKGWVDSIRLHMFELYDIRSKHTKKEAKLEEESIYWDDWVKAWMPLLEPYNAESEE